MDLILVSNNKEKCVSILVLRDLDEDSRSLHQQPEEEMSARAGAESGKAAAH